MKSKLTTMDWILEFLNSEKTLFLLAGIIGLISVVVGLLFLLFSNQNSFAITMLVLGILEMTAMFPTYFKYQQKIEDKISLYQSDSTEFVKTETIAAEKALKSFFWLKLTYGISIVVLIWTMSFLSPKSLLLGVFMALILHLAFAITIDNFGEIYTKKYLSELQTAEK